MRLFSSNQAQALPVHLVRPATPSSRTMLHGPSPTAVISETNHYRLGKGVSPHRLLSFNNKHETTPEIPGHVSTNLQWKNNPHKHTLVPLEGNDQLRNRLLLPLLPSQQSTCSNLPLHPRTGQRQNPLPLPPRCHGPLLRHLLHLCLHDPRLPLELYLNCLKKLSLLLIATGVKQRMLTREVIMQRLMRAFRPPSPCYLTNTRSPS